MKNRPLLSDHQTRYIRVGFKYICENKGCRGTLELDKRIYDYCPWCGRRIVEFCEE